MGLIFMFNKKAKHKVIKNLNIYKGSENDIKIVTSTESFIPLFRTCFCILNCGLG